MSPHDRELYEQAQAAGFNYTRMRDLESLCLTREGRDAIHDLAVSRYHEEEAKAGML